MISIVQDALKRGVAPSRIGFVSFTKKAANEGRDRARLIQKAPFQYFQTLHSLAFTQLGYTRPRVMNGKVLHDFAAWMGLDLNFSRTFSDEGQYQRATPDDRALFTINLARIQRRPLREVAREAELDWSLVNAVSYGLRRFKAERGLVDFTDMIENFIKTGTAPELDLLCIDEAQDMSALQWEMADKLMERGKEVVIAGDDDQAIFGWAGADTDRFRRCAVHNPTRVLDQSYRVPRSVQEVATNVRGRLRDSVPKVWRGRDAEGRVEHLADFREAPLDTGRWLILARNAHLLGPVYAYLEEQGWSEDGRVSVSTIHRAKGGEADNVLLLTDVAQRTWEGIDTDDEHRVWYVAVTRARENLYIVNPQTRYYYEVQ